MKYLLIILLSVFMISESFARGGGFGGGGGRGGGFGGGGRSGGFSGGSHSSGSSGSHSSGSSSSRSGGFGKSSGSGSSSSKSNSGSSRSWGFGKSSTPSKSTNLSQGYGYSAKQSTRVYIYRSAPMVYFYHPIFGFGYYHSNMSLVEMYIWHTLLFPRPIYNTYNTTPAPVTCKVDRDCMVNERCEPAKNICIKREW